MFVKVKTTGIMCSDIMIPEGVCDTSKLFHTDKHSGEKMGLEDKTVKELIKNYPNDIEAFEDEKPKAKKKADKESAEKEDSEDVEDSKDTDENDGSKDYDDITGPQLIAFLKGKVKGDLPSEKKELYALYKDQFEKA